MLFLHCLFFFQYFHVPDSATFSICPGDEQPAVKSSSLPCWDLMPDISQSALDASLLQKQLSLAFSPAAGADSSQCWSLPAVVRQEFPRQSVAVPFGNCRENGFCTRYFTYAWMSFPCHYSCSSRYQERRIVAGLTKCKTRLYFYFLWLVDIVCS